MISHALRSAVSRGLRQPRQLGVSPTYLPTWSRKFIVKTRARLVTGKAVVEESTAETAMSNGYDYDLLVIGAGSGGVRASRFASSYGAKTAIVELPFGLVSSDEVGGAGGT